MGTRRKKSGIGAVRYDIFGNVLPEAPAQPVAPAPAPVRTIPIDVNSPMFNDLRNAEERLINAEAVAQQSPSEDATNTVRAAQNGVNSARQFFSDAILASWDKARERALEALRTKAKQESASPEATIKNIFGLINRQDIERNIPIQNDSNDNFEQMTSQLRSVPVPSKASLQSRFGSGASPELRELRSQVESAILSEAYSWANHIERLYYRGQSAAHWELMTERIKKLIDLRIAIIEAQETYPPVMSTNTAAGRRYREQVRQTLYDQFANDVKNAAYESLAERNAEARYEGMPAIPFQGTFWSDWTKKIRRNLRNDERLVNG